MKPFAAEHVYAHSQNIHILFPFFMSEVYVACMCEYVCVCVCVRACLCVQSQMKLSIAKANVCDSARGML